MIGSIETEKKIYMKQQVKQVGLWVAAGFLLVNSAQAQSQSAIKPFAPSDSFRSWSIQVNGGLMNQSNLFGYRRHFNQMNDQFGYGASIKKYFLPNFALSADYFGGKLGGANDATGQSFETNIPWSAALSAQVGLANINFRHKEGVIKPYLQAGYGLMAYENTLMNGNASTTRESTAKFIPAALGVKFGLMPGLMLDVAYQLNATESRWIDGRAGTRKDLFSYAKVGLEFALGNSDKPFLGNSNPVRGMQEEYQGLYDELQAENQRQKAELESTKNSLNGQINSLLNDLKDDDGDGVANKFDQCPGTPKGVKVDGSGCPLPEVKAPVIQQITITEEDKRVVADAIANLEFDLGKATIRPTSHASLNKVAALLIEKNFSLKLAGHTDNTGSLQLNLKLSKDRAESVKAYLVSKGANPSRIEATGYGPNQPIATNATAEGRQQNRRVEFTLF